jgi:membrane AbrB-like protein
VDIAILIGCAICGYGLGLLLRFPAPQMFGPLIASVIVHGVGFTQSSPPHWAIAIAQVFLGVFAGVRFVGIRIGEIWRVLMLSAVWAIILLAIIACFALAVSHIMGLHPSLLLLAFAPGGFAEISMLSMAAGISLAFVTTMQLIRMVFTVLLAPMVIGAVMKRRRRVKEPVDRASKI